MDRTDGRTALALQGGASHGAFQWGVLDRLLETGALHAPGGPFPDVCGVSSGALNAVALVQGWARGGAEGARAELRRLWEGLSGSQAMTPLRSGVMERWIWGWDLSNTVAWQGLETALRVWGPEQLNPFGFNPLRPVVAGLLDPGALTSAQAPRLQVGVTDVETGRPVLFDNEAITIEVLLASCCLPFLFAPVRIEKRTFWDGSYSGNPPLAPLLQPVPPETLVLVRAQSTARSKVPHTAQGIINRLSELASQNVLDTELAALPPETRLVDYRADGVLDELPMSSKFNVDEEFLHMLFEAGRRAVPAAMGPVRSAAA